nr:hypothetical protein GCM10020093_111180 [Planobispora longispora]
MAALAAQGWWFAQEKAVLALPLVVLPALVAVPLAGPFLVAAARGVPRRLRRPCGPPC